MSSRLPKPMWVCPDGLATFRSQQEAHTTLRVERVAQRPLPVVVRPLAAGRKQTRRGDDPVTAVSFSLNGNPVTIQNPDPLMMLNEYIRSVSGLVGTKKGCGEGGCGACTVTMVRYDPALQQTVHEAINSCLRPVCSLTPDVNIVTVEGVGGSRTGFNPIQTAIADGWGSQCGFCTPGHVMNMYSFLQDNPQPSAQQIEDLFDGNLCRCTGYRPILDAMKSFAADSDPSNRNRSRAGECGGRGKCGDIEDLCCRTRTAAIGSKTSPSGAAAPVVPRLVQSNGVSWYNPSSLDDVFGIMAANAGSTIKLVVGNTSVGVFKDVHPTVFINIGALSELTQVSIGVQGVTFGAAVSIADMMELLTQYAEQNPGYQTSSFPKLVEHMTRVANTQVRNAGSWAGNLMMAHDNNDFPSDLLTILFGVGASISVQSSSDQADMLLDQFLTFGMSGYVITGITIPYMRQNEYFSSYKVMLRHVNSHALVNAAFRVLLDGNNNVVEQPTLVYGGIAPQAIRLTVAETGLMNQCVTDSTAMSAVLSVIDQNVNPDPAPGKVAYRKSLASALFFKFLVSLQPPASLPPTLQSVAEPFVRPVTSGTQTFQYNTAQYPIGVPMPKLEAKLQASGEATYTDDIPSPAGCLFAAFVTSTVACATIKSIDPSAALAAAGVRQFFSAADLGPQRNQNAILTDEELLASTEVSYYGQPIGIVIADTQRHADEAAALVSVTYSNVQSPILTIPEAIAANSFFTPDPTPLTQGNVAQGFSQSANIIAGTVSTGFQNHFFLEPFTVLCQPQQNQGMLVISGSQFPQLMQICVASAAGMAQSNVTIQINRCGGAYGGKITRNLGPYAVVAFACSQLGVAVRSAVNFNTGLDFGGKRHPFTCNYKVGTGANGKIIAAELDLYINKGAFLDSGAPLWSVFKCIDNCYNFPNFLCTAKVCKTNLPPCTSMRGPGWIQAIFIMEHVMEHCANQLGLDPDAFRQLNMYTAADVTPYGESLLDWRVPTLWEQLVQSADYSNRLSLVQQYNQANRWTKRGISIVPLKWGIDLVGRYPSLISIQPDGTISVSITGIEIGQGINTKCAQAAAMALGAPLKYVTVLPVTTTATPNPPGTGGSTTSELNVGAVLDACAQLNALLGPVRAAMGPLTTWSDLIAQANDDGYTLTAVGSYTPSGPKLPGPQNYNVYGVACSEVLLDVLTGENQILRCDVLFDLGTSMNPAIDIGQIEGAFVQGVGMHMTEEVLIDSTVNLGALISNGTWEYKPPSSRDIPIDFRISLLANAPNPFGLLGAKAVGEPPFALSCGVLLAAQRAIAAARSNVNVSGPFELDSPATVDKLQQACLVDVTQFVF